jgi:sporulation-control protein spo0M
VWGARQFGFFAVYAETKTFEMILEIDAQERIIHWLLTESLASDEQQCRVTYLD